MKQKTACGQVGCAMTMTTLLSLLLPSAPGGAQIAEGQQVRFQSLGAAPVASSASVELLAATAIDEGWSIDWEEDPPRLLRPGLPSLPLARRLPVLRLPGSGGFLQWGDPDRSHHQGTTDLFWFNDLGEPTRELRRAYAAGAFVRAEADGLVVVAGQRLGEQRSEIAFYPSDASTPSARCDLGLSTVVSLELVEGQLAIASVVERERNGTSWIARCESSTGETARVEGLGVVQRLERLPGTTRFFVQAVNSYALVDASVPATLWETVGRVRLTSSDVVIASPDDTLIFVTDAALSDGVSSRLLAFDSKTGTALGATAIFPGLVEHLAISAGDAQVLEAEVADGSVRRTERFAWALAECALPECRPRLERQALSAIPVYDESQGEAGALVFWCAAENGARPQEVYRFELDPSGKQVSKVELGLAKRGPRPCEDSFRADTCHSAGRCLELLDADAGGSHAFRYELTFVDGTSLASNVTTTGITWPVPLEKFAYLLQGHYTPRDLENGVADSHEGVDIVGRDDDTKVIAAAGGVVRHVAVVPQDGGTFKINVAMTKGQVGVDRYLHVKLPAISRLPGDVIAAGDSFGIIDPDFFEDFPEHLHWSTIDGRWNPRNPMLVSASFAALDQSPPRIEGLSVVSVDSEMVLADEPGVLLARGDVDLVARVYDRMSGPDYSGEPPRFGPFAVGFWIEGPDGARVMADEVSPFELVRFDDVFSTAGGVARDALCMTCDDASVSDVGLRVFGQWVLTNASYVRGKGAGIDDASCWSTSAAKHRYPGTGCELKQASSSKQAMFPDGSYQVHVVVSDINETQRVSEAFTVVVDNWMPVATEVEVRDGEKVAYRARNRWCRAAGSYRWRAGRSRSVPKGAGAAVAVQVRFSEPMAAVSIDLEGPDDSSVALELEGEGAEWTALIQRPLLEAEGRYRLSLRGRDLAGRAVVDPRILGDREGVANVTPEESVDRLHSFVVSGARR